MKADIFLLFSTTIANYLYWHLILFVLFEPIIVETECVNFDRMQRFNAAKYFYSIIKMYFDKH